MSLSSEKNCWTGRKKMDLKKALAAAKTPFKTRPEILLCPNIPKPLHGLAPRVILGEAWWNETRQAAYRSTGHHCIACGVHKRHAKYIQWLEGHELYKTDYKRGTLTYIETVPLCHSCHSFIHDGLMEALLRRGVIDLVKFNDVMDHGNRVLKAAKLRKNRRTPKVIAPWSKWRLVLSGKEYPTRFKDYKEWEMFYYSPTIALRHDK